MDPRTPVLASDKNAWSNVIPLLPLARGVPIRMQFLAGDERWYDAYSAPVMVNDTDTSVRENAVDLLSVAGFLDDKDAEWNPQQRVIVDLDAPLGFLHALSVWRQRRAQRGPPWHAFLDLDLGTLTRALDGAYTEEDKLQLACVLYLQYIQSTRPPRPPVAGETP